MLNLSLFFLGFICLWKGGDTIVDGASGLARRFRVSEVIIGLVLVSVGTSLPELVVNFFASLKQEHDIVFGNIIGSNISNTFLICGLVGLVSPFNLKNTKLKIESFLYLSLIIVLWLFTFAFTNTPSISTTTATILLLFFVSALVIFVKKNNTPSTDLGTPIPSLLKALLLFLCGCLLLPLGGQLVLHSAINIATNFGLSKAFISLFAIALGTSLPELVASLMASLKNKSDMAIGNIVGSNIFNLSLILGFSALVSPLKLSLSFYFDFIICMISGLLLIVLFYLPSNKKCSRAYCFLLSLSYVGYIGFIYIR